MDQPTIKIITAIIFIAVGFIQAAAHQKGRHEIVRDVVASNSLAIAEKVSLMQNVPNPCDSLTTISWTLPDRQHIKLSLYDNLGRFIIVALDTTLDRGGYRTTLSLCDMPHGLYYYRLEYKTESISKRMVVMGCK